MNISFFCYNPPKAKRRSMLMTTEELLDEYPSFGNGSGFGKIRP